MGKTYLLSSQFTLASGTPITLPEAFVSDTQYIYNYFVYGSINNQRLPVYHRLDVSLSKQKLSKKGNKRTILLNIYNVYARQNATTIYYKSHNGKMYQKSMFSIIPSITIVWEFNQKS